MKVVVATVGFDEKLPLRGIMKFGLSEEDVVLLVYSKTGGEFEAGKVEKTVEALKDLVSNAGVRVADIVVSESNFYEDVVALINTLKSHGAGEIVAVIAGGMRLLVFEVLAALMLLHKLTGVRSSVYVSREDGLYDVVVPVDMFYVELSSGDDAVLRKLYDAREMKRSRLVDAVSTEYNLSKSMVYKVLKSLVKKKLVTVENDTVKLTELGRLVYEVVKRE